MANYWGRSGAPMIQPTKDEIRSWLAEARAEAKEERTRRQVAEFKLRTATKKLGELVLEGKIAIPIERLGELAIQLAIDDECERERRETKKLIAEN